MGRPRSDELLTPKEDYMAAWYAALNSPAGVAVRAFPRESVRVRLMAIRTQIGDPQLLGLEIVQPAHAENELWIIKKRTP